MMKEFNSTLRLLLAMACLFSTGISHSKEYSLLSPDGKIELMISVEEGIRLQAEYDSEKLFVIDHLSLDIENKDLSFRIRKSIDNSVDRKIYPEVREKYKEIEDRYNELQVLFKDNYSLTFRAYDAGIAYRFYTSFKDNITILRENMNIHFAENDSVILQKSATFRSAYESPYEQSFIKDVSTGGYCCLPALVQKNNGIKVLITESDLTDYPGFWLKATGTATFKGVNPNYPLSLDYNVGPYARGKVDRVAGYIAKVKGTRSYPWRIFAVAENDGQLLENTMVYQMATPCQIEDVSWIKPGVVTFDWWGKRSIYGVDFESGVNTATAKYFIDFASEFGFEYFLFDDGWSKKDDLFAINPDLDMEEVLAYAKEKGVKIMLWVIWNTFEQQEDRAWEQFEEWGISGIKFDFMNRDDQLMVQFYDKVSREAARRKMVIDFHGSYKPAGLRRTYPNVLTREGLIEFEQNGGSHNDTPEHHNLLPYIRMVAGPMDYIPFTTQNVQKRYFRTMGGRPMGMGTRAHSMALFVILESPMQMLPDSPSDYYRERECTEFISRVPTQWDDLKVLHAKIGEHTVVARKKDDNWFVGAITNWDAKEFDIDLDFLDSGNYQIEIIEDGTNAAKRAIDYRRITKNISKNSSINIKLVPGGGWVARITKK